MKLKNNKGVFYLLEQNFNLKCYRKHSELTGIFKKSTSLNRDKVCKWLNHEAITCWAAVIF